MQSNLGQRLIRFAVLLTLSGLATACVKPETEIVVIGQTMGTQYKVTVISEPLSAQDKQVLEEAVSTALESVNQSMSTYIPTSELSVFNRAPMGYTATLSEDLHTVLFEALQISELSDGAFDATLGKAIRLWGFAEDGQIEKQPSDETLALTRSSVGYERLVLDGRKLTKLADGLEINLSAIAKGFAVDKVADAIDALGYQHYLINVGGELKARGVNLAGNVWRVGIEKPHVLGGVAEVLVLKDKAVATSGDYRNFIVIDGQQFSHTIDPTTLRPVLHKLASVSVISDRASTADALATAILAKGDQEGLKFARDYEIAAYFIIRDESAERYRVETTGGFNAFLPE